MGRYHRPHSVQLEFVASQAARLCGQCSSGEVEDEEHFLFHCDKFAVERIKLLGIVNSDIDHTPNITSLFS